MSRLPDHLLSERSPEHIVPATIRTVDEDVDQEPIIDIPPYTEQRAYQEISGAVVSHEITVEMADTLDARLAMYLAIRGTRRFAQDAAGGYGSDIPPNDTLYRFTEDQVAGTIQLAFAADHQSFRSRYAYGYSLYLHGLSEVGRYSDEVSNRRAVMAQVLMGIPDARSPNGIVHRRSFSNQYTQEADRLAHEAELVARGIDYVRYGDGFQTHFVTTAEVVDINFDEHFRVEVFTDEQADDVRHLVHGAFLVGVFAHVERDTNIGTTVVMSQFDTSRDELIRSGQESLAAQRVMADVPDRIDRMMDVAA